MAAILAGTSSSINATTIEGQLWQGVHWIELQERLSSDEGRFSFSKDDTFVLTGDFTLPMTLTRDNSTGLFTTAAGIYLPTGSNTFIPGTEGTIKGNTFAQYFIDVCQYIVIWQNNKDKNPQNLRNVTLTSNFNQLEFTGTINLPYQAVLGPGGAVTETATEWLLT